MQADNVDLELEKAFAQEAVYSYERYAAYGVTPEDFGDLDMRAIVEAARDTWEAGGATTPEAVAATLQRSGRLASLGGPAAFAQRLVGVAVPDPARLRELRRLRKLYEGLTRAAWVAKGGDLAAATAAIQEAHSAAMESSATGQLLTGCDIVEGLFQRLVDKARDQAMRIYPGLDEIESAIGFLPAGSLTVVGGNTNTGKSSFVLEMMLGCMARDMTVGFVSLEDPEEVTATRIMSAFSGVDGRVIVRRTMERDDWSRLADGANRWADIGKRFLFADCIGGTELDVCASMSRMAARGARIVVVDYLGVIEASSRQQDRRNEIRWVLTRIKAHAKRLGVAVIVVSQLSRPKDGNPNKEPTKHDLKEAGDVEASAEFIIVLWRVAEHDFAPIHAKIAKSKVGGNGYEWRMQRDPHSGRLKMGVADDEWESRR